jgi:hypothetical protein
MEQRHDRTGFGVTNTPNAPEATLPVANEANFIKPPRAAGNVWRRIAALLVSVVMMVILLFGTFGHIASHVLGSSKNASDFIIGVATTPSVSTAIADQALQTIGDREGAAVAASISSHHTALVAAITQVINSSSTQVTFRSDIYHLYNIIHSGSGGTVNFAPLAQALVNQMHQTDPSIPADTSVIGDKFVVHIKSGRRVATGFGGIGAWLAIVLALIGAVLVARFLVRHPIRQLVCVGLTIALPGFLELLIGAAAKRTVTNWHAGSSTAKALIEHVVDKISSQVTEFGLGLVVVAIGVVIVWMVIRVIADHTNRNSVPAAG